MPVKKRYNVRASTGRKKDDGKFFWVNVGSAWELENGGFSVTLDALPLPVYDEKFGLQTRLLLFPADEAPAAAQAQAPFKAGALDDEIPF
jgi:hypothetical protein